MSNTRKIGRLIVQERNTVCPDGAKVWVVRSPEHGTVYHSQSKRDAIAWATNSRYAAGEGEYDH